MIPASSIDELAQRLAAILPPGLKEAREDIGANFRSVLQAGLGKLDLVTREEFDAQTRVLAHTRAKLERLEQQLAEFERDARVE